ncbi:hypothetical protein GCM10022140_47840 [Rhodococcus aetherivorans]
MNRFHSAYVLLKISRRLRVVMATPRDRDSGTYRIPSITTSCTALSLIADRHRNVNPGLKIERCLPADGTGTGFRFQIRPVGLETPMRDEALTLR